MIIYANLQLNLSISFWGEDFQRINMHYNRKNSPTPIGSLINWRSKFILAILVEGHYMIIYPNLQLNLSISFWGEDFQRINMHYNRKNSPTPVGAPLIDGASLF